MKKTSPVVEAPQYDIPSLLDIQKRYIKLISIVEKLRVPGETSEQTLNRLLADKK